MSWSLPVSCCLVSALMLATCSRRAPELRVLGESARMPLDADAVSASPLFDGSSLRLRAARGETLGVQVRQGKGGGTVSLTLDAPETTVQPFEVRALEVVEPSTSMYGSSTGPGRYPDVLVPTVEAVSSEAAFFDVRVSTTAEPGTYTGTLRISERTFPVELRVSSARIDLEQDPLVWSFYAPREVARAHGLPDGDSAELITRETEYFMLFRRHGVLLASDLPPARFQARRRFVEHTKLWPVAIDSSSDDAIERDVHAWLELFRGTGVTPFAIPIDEPRTPEAKARARHVGEVMGQAGGKRPSLLRAVTDHPDPAYGDAFDVYVSPQSLPADPERTARGERFWTYNGRQPQAGSMILDTEGAALRSWGWIAERYGVELWYVWEGLYFSDRYNHRRPTDIMLDPVTFDERASGGTDFGNGDGVLAYPGALPSLRLKTLRRGLQDRLLLRELARCGAASEARRIVLRVVPHALGEAKDRTSFLLEEPAFERVHDELLDLIEARCHD